VEWDTFSQVMRDLELNPHEILQALEEHFRCCRRLPDASCAWRLPRSLSSSWRFTRRAAPDDRRSSRRTCFQRSSRKAREFPCRSSVGTASSRRSS
jgi:hypothetical protein